MNQPNTTATFIELNRKVSSVSLQFDRQQSLLQVALQQAIHQAVDHTQPESPHKAISFFEGAWLPGPLSYPWLVVIVSLPQILETFFHMS